MHPNSRTLLRRFKPDDRAQRFRLLRLWIHQKSGARIAREAGGMILPFTLNRDASDDVCVRARPSAGFQYRAPSRG